LNKRGINYDKRKTFQKTRKEKILKKYHKVVVDNSAEARSLIKKLNFKNDAYLLQCIAQTSFDESLFNSDGSQRKYFENRKLRLAEKYIIKAYEIQEDCIDVLWTLGLIRKAYNQIELAIFCFKRIIELGSKGILKKDNCTDRFLIKVKVNDSKFQLYRLCFDKGDILQSKKYLSKYKNGVEKGIDTLYKPLEKFLLD